MQQIFRKLADSIKPREIKRTSTKVKPFTNREIPKSNTACDYAE